MWITELLIGIACGVALSLFFSFGPAFFTQLQLSIQYGFRKASPFAFGVSAGDIIIVFLMLTVLKNVNLFEALHNVWVASIGGVVLAFMGIYNIRRKVTSVEGRGHQFRFRTEGEEPTRRSILFQGLVINFVNPLIWVYWVSVIALITGEFDLSVSSRYAFFGGLLLATLGLDILKCKLASLLQRIITAKVLNITNKATAVIMFVFAAYIVISMVVYQVNPQAREKEQQQTPQSTEMIKKFHERTDSLNLNINIGKK